MPVARLTLSSLPAFTLLSAVVGFGCGSSEHYEQPGAPRAGTSGEAGETGVGGSATGGTSSGGSSGASSAGRGGSAAGGTGGLSGGGGSSGAAGRDGSSGAPSTLKPHAIAGTPHGTCALDNAGKIACWGLAPKVWNVPEGNFVELYSGQSSTGTICAVRSDRTVACFYEPLGTSYTDFDPTLRVKSLAIGLGVICGIDENDNAFCNAYNASFELAVPSEEKFSLISAGNQFGCGISSSDGTVACWQADGFGTCDYSPPDNQLDAPAGAFDDISSSEFTTCAIGRDGKAKCWGLGEADDDPNGDQCFAENNAGQAEPPADTFRAVVVGSFHTCAVRTDGSLACWGAGEVDTCVDMSVDCGQSIPPEGTFEQVSVGLFHSCAMRADRTVACWGYDGDGDGRTTPPDAFQ